MQQQTKTVYKEKMVELPLEQTPFIKINCPSCGCETPASDINLESKVGKCQSCNAVYSIADNIDHLQSIALKKEVDKPEGVDVYHYNDEMEMEIEQPWSGLEIIAISILPMFVLISTLLFFKKGISYLWPAGALLATVYSIISLVNRKNHKILITVDDKYLHLIWKPSKLMPSKKIRVSDIDQVYIKNMNSMYYIYAVINGPRGQKHQNLVGGFTSHSMVRYIEQELEKFLALPDKALPEEAKTTVIN